MEPSKPNLLHAKRLMAAIHLEIAMGTFSYAKHFPDSPNAALFDDARLSAMTVGDAPERYLSGLKPAREYSTWRDYRSAANHHLVPAFGDVPLRELNTRHVREWLGGLVISAKRINNVMVPLRGMLADAHADGMIEVTPWTG